MPAFTIPNNAPGSMPPAGAAPPNAAPPPPAPPPVPDLSPEDLSTLAAAFTPDVMAVLEKLAGNGGAEPEGDEDMGAPSAPAPGPSALPRPQTSLNRV